ncbi:MAG: hypothetical protein OEW04_06540 [Nitrospirota bacterium]|nr:hypothetical protein [Nitrospirota bacterium]
MRAIYTIKRLKDIASALLTQTRLRKHEQWTRRELEEFQQKGLAALVKHAVGHSPFYRKLYRDININEKIILDSLPIIDKATIMENFDIVVTEPRLKLIELQDHIAQLSRDDYHLGEYRIVTTSGSSGLKGVFVFNRKEYSTVLACGLRCSSFMGVSPRLPKRWRGALIGASSPMHVTNRFYSIVDVGLHNFQRLAATVGIEHLVESLNAFKPDWLCAYTSIASVLADEQREGRLDIHPRVISTNAEVLTMKMKQKITETWGVQPFNTYGMSESGLVFASDCSFHRGLHVYEDLFIAEVVDEHNSAVPEGSPGYKLLITNLFNYTQPLIRYEVSDMITMAKESCPCGRPFRLIAEIGGRTEDIIYLRNHQGERVPVHPLHLENPLESLRDVKEYQIFQEEDKLRVVIVLLQGGSEEEVSKRLREKVRNSLDSLGAICPEIQVRFVGAIRGDPQKMGKLKRIKSIVRTEEKSRRISAGPGDT